MKQNNADRSPQVYLRDDLLPSLLSGSYAFVSSLTYFFIPLFLQDHLKFSGSKIGLLYAGLSITGLFITFPIGFLNDLFTPRTLIVLSLITTALALWGQGFATNFIPFFLVFLLFGVSNNIFRTSLDALMFKGAQEENRGTRYGLFNAMRMIGFTAGALFAGYALLSFDFTAKLRHLSVFALALVLVYPFLAATPGKRWELFNYRKDFFKKEVIVFSLWLFFSPSTGVRSQPASACFFAITSICRCPGSVTIWQLNLLPWRWQASGAEDWLTGESARSGCCTRGSSPPD